MSDADNPITQQNLDKLYDPAPVEQRWWQAWENSGIFSPSKTSPGGEPYCIVIPPPNVTGSLHIGHALNNTLQDILVRYHRMNGKAALWVFGMDHAGIATQNVVERRLAQEGRERKQMGREAFVEKVWEWKQESGGRIRNQLKRLGASLDYEHEHFTMDEGLSKAVRHVFVKLYEQGLIYRAKRLVNWDCELHTAISDLEVISKEQKGHLWHLRYPLAEDPQQSITVATTRPETMLGDTAVAVHPKDPRYQHLIGRKVCLPLAGREIPIIADEYSDPEKGSGAVKITPAHDFNDFEVGARHRLAAINILTEDGKLNDQVPSTYQGLDRFIARQKIVEDLESLGLVEKIEDHTHAVPYGDRSGTVIEPMLTDQWFVDAKKLAGPAIAAVEKGETKFIPKNWEKTYFEWMRNIQPWCISRQLWWGHRIPAWYGPDDKIFVAQNEAEALQAAQKHYGNSITLTQDSDVLDTWFSSALWPFSTLGWPEQTPELQFYYPTSVLVTSFDIIFFWVARMMMMGLHFTEQAPFKDVYIHALIRDAQGQKMSKSKGNVIDPLELMEKHGTDALRFTLTAFAAQGRDIKLSEERVLGYRNFCNKIWNGARLVLSLALPNADLLSLQQHDFALSSIEAKHPISQWILAELSQTIAKTRESIETYRFNDAAQALYQFFWSVYCDWFLEFLKPSQKQGDAQTETPEQKSIRQEFATVAILVLDQSMRLLHPIMPFLTEEIWQKMAKREKLLPQAAYPQALSQEKEYSFRPSHKLLQTVCSMVEKVRQIRMETGVPLSERLTRVSFYSEDKVLRAQIDSLRPFFLDLAGLSNFKWNDESLTQEKGLARGVTDIQEIVVRFDLKNLVDLNKERLRQEKELKKIEQALVGNQKTLQNPQFLEKSPPELQEEMRQTVAKYQRRIAEIKEGLKEL